MSAVTDLLEEIKKHRENVAAEAQAYREAFTSPFGTELDTLNREWGQFQAAHDAKIQKQRDEYLAKRTEILGKISDYFEGNPKPERSNKRGRKPRELPDAVKIAAARAIEEGATRSLVRAMLAMTNTPKFNAILEQGKALLEASTPTPSPTNQKEDFTW